jgi:hypothetical protein
VLRVETRPKRSHRGLGPRRLGEVSIEAHAARSQKIEVRAGVPLVAVTPEVIGAQRIDQDEENVEVRALGESF